MKIKPLILALPVLCFACNTASTPADPASQMDASPIHAKKVVGVNMLTVDFDYDDPCNILGEEYLRSTFNIGLTTKLDEIHDHDGCAFTWSGNKVNVSFGGARPYSSIYQAEYVFDRKFQGKPDEGPIPMTTAPQEATITQDSDEGNSVNATVTDTKAATSDSAATDTHPNHGGVTAASPRLTKPPVSTERFEAVPELGDKAVWNPDTGAMHVLYNNHIINVMIQTKDKPEAKKEHAKNIAEVLIDKILGNEYIRRL